MFRIQSYTLGPVQTNAYVLTNETANEAIVIDPGMNPESLLEALKGVDVKAILLTHAHFDHIGGVDRVREAHGDCPVYIHEREADWLTTPELNGSTMWPQVSPPMSMKPAEHLLRDGQTLELIGHDFQVMHTPGHSPGSVSFLHEKHLFSGDVLFRTSVGRTDLRDGDMGQLLQSIHGKLFPLADDVTVYSGHGPVTTIGYEKQHNPFV
ncbi:MBL fold metallo-hydrolase [Paenibacillus apiarius]|uniref:MBL fold metallo-hydrolase n=1 Tax=Paenibacillus apiarius TaxID=46240 RepID=A0ABT4DNZ8_9BACL|nr:MBL fold metallo-hydrolase [Paenibacillus apiarius]MBN3525381.1 MBL fold metallo-hydrolase [Paenibacillus apiarius]MCY9512771.1 MBL fold metallo-hydrolase [Paenibacillus apiarius]MCY9519085.1 MBL fold metallo-hydrolase [Paenibacillus apiarius]MCY9554709.1 MBL fold metallo-hydrolase [Paenibacillus apiarius]MCY9559672.1 MBL fold metallo-hydrolase [Paenibacillus apiarius]